MRKATLIYNPHAGPLDCADMVEGAARYWRERDWEVTIWPTEREGHATELARKAADMGQTLVFAAGGDGTQGEVANGLAKSDTIMATLPIGTGNSLAKELHMPRPSRRQPNKLIEAAEALYKGNVHSADLGQIEDGRYWLLWCSVGIDSYLVNEIEPRSKRFKRLGAAGYVLKGAYKSQNLPSWQRVVEIDGNKISGDFLLALVSNCRFFGGGVLELSPGAMYDDGHFEVWLFPGNSRREVVWRAWQVFSGGHLEDNEVTMVPAKQVRVTADPAMPFQIDGEVGGATPFSAELRPDALKMLIPNTAPDTLFGRPGQPISEY